MTSKRTIYILLVALLLLLIGAGIYFFFRTSIIAFSLCNIAPNEYNAGNTNNPFIYFLIFCLPDALWYMSLLLVQTLFLFERGWLNHILVGVAISLPFFWETGQYFDLVSGTFDWFDVITYCITLILFLCLKKTSLLLFSK